MSRLILTDANLLDGLSPPVPGQTVVVEGDRIAAVGPHLPQPDDRVVPLGGRTVMPGMAMCHFHSTYRNVGSGPYGNEYPPSYQALIAHKNLLAALEHGYTTVVGAGAARDVEPGIKQAIDEGYVTGPRFWPSGRELSTTGHSNEMSAPWHWGLPTLGAARVCDGPEQFRFAVRDEVKRGVEVIKLFVTGGHGVLGSKDDMVMTRDELAAAIDTAHSRGVLVRGHLAGKEPIMTAIELGIDIVDHCDDMDDDVIAALVETGTYAVPSLQYPKAFAGLIEAFSPGGSAGIQESLHFMYEALPKADAAGVRLLLGDDYGGPGLDHGDYGGALHIYVEEAGISPLSVIRWATHHGAQLVGLGDQLGTVEPGKIADLLVIDGNPAQDISALADNPPVAVLKSGHVVAGALPA
ncbi:MAG TPA: amidohydrolase family protein [Acidimicrobiales bacterium]|nr:amidohydrolase family protein [Acidimicrobiales bacterium]